MWDPTVLWHDGLYYMVSMYKTAPDAPDDYMWLAKSFDGVHWESVGPVLEDKQGVCKMFLYRIGDDFAINFGSFSKEERKENDTLRYYRSKDMRNWEYLSENHPDPRWYHENGRWDHMYVYEENGVYYGYPVAIPLPEQKSAWGLCKSTDGYHWECCPPPVIQWGEIPRINFLEIGGLEKINGRYYLIGGYVGYAGNYGYSLYTFTADHPEGPFVPDREAFRLCGFDRLPGKLFVQNLAAFARGENGELLISNAVMGEGLEDVWLLPMRKAVLDKKGHLRLEYWQGNEVLKGKELPVTKEMQSLTYADETPSLPAEQGGSPVRFEPKDQSCFAASCHTGGTMLDDRNVLMMLQEKLDLEQGIIMECTVKAESSPSYDKENCAALNWRPASVGVYMEETADPGENQGTAITLEIGHPYKRYSHVEQIRIQNDRLERRILDTIGEGCAEVRGIDAGREIKLRLFYRRHFFELYADDRLVQCFLNQGTPTGRIGICLLNAAVEITDWKIYPMTL